MFMNTGSDFDTNADSGKEIMHFTNEAKQNGTVFPVLRLTYSNINLWNEDASNYEKHRK